MKTHHRTGTAALILGCLALATPTRADHLDPRVLGPLQALFQRAAMLCQAGNGMACQQARELQQAEAQLSQAQHACQAGNQQACAFYQNGAMQVVGAYQQMQAQPAPGFGQAQTQEQMTRDHQFRMQQQQMQFQQQQQNYQRQQQMNDEQHRRFIEQLRR